MEYSSDDTKQLAKALISVQRDMSPASKDSTNPFCRSKYASLNSVMESCRSALLENGVWLTQLPVPAPVEYGVGHIALLTKLTHADSGQWQASLTIAPLPKNDPQGMGSALTYCRRYALTAMLGIVTEDDDGEAAKSLQQAPRSAQNSQKTATPHRMRSNRSNFDEGPFDEQILMDDKNNGLKSILEGQKNLPSLPGISYEVVADNEGRNCIVATGNTLPQKAHLAQAGFSWNPQRKVWWKYCEAA